MQGRCGGCACACVCACVRVCCAHVAPSSKPLRSCSSCAAASGCPVIRRASAAASIVERAVASGGSLNRRTGRGGDRNVRRGSRATCGIRRAIRLAWFQFPSSSTSCLGGVLGTIGGASRYGNTSQVSGWSSPVGSNGRSRCPCSLSDPVESRVASRLPVLVGLSDSFQCCTTTTGMLHSTSGRRAQQHRFRCRRQRAQRSVWWAWRGMRAVYLRPSEMCTRRVRAELRPVEA